jgi:hypothetical protein
MTLSEAATEIQRMMKLCHFDCVASAEDGYVRVWNCYSGAIMGAYNRDLDGVCDALGMTWSRKRTFGNGMIIAADWEDRAVFTTGGAA